MDYGKRYGPWALVIGASQGLGKAIAAESARRKLNVAMVARRPAPLAEAARAMEEQFGVRTKTISADLADPDIVAILEKGLEGEEVSFLVYNTAAEPEGEFLKQYLREHINNIAVNVTAPTVIVHHFGRKMAARGKGGIVLCSSLAANQGIYNYVSYGAAKAYEMILGEGLWDEFADYGVDACTLMIGSTYTPNFQEKQKAKNTPFAETRTPGDLPQGVPVPQRPEDAAAHLFRQIDGDWLPLIYANPEDEKRAADMRDMSRVELIRRMSGAMRTGFRAEMR